MTANVRVIVENDADTATLSASPALVTTLPVTNLQNVSRCGVARTSSTADQEILGTWSADRCLSHCTLYRHNLTSDGTVQLELFSGASQTGSLLYDSGAVDAHPIKALGDMDLVYDPLATSVFTGWEWAFTSIWFDALWCRSFRLTLSDGSNAAGYLQASRLVLGRHFEPLNNFSYGVEMAWDEGTQSSRTEGGSLRSENTESFRRIKFSLNRLNDGERARVTELTRVLGRRKDFFVSCYPTVGGAKERDYSAVCKFSSIPPLVHPVYGVYAAQFQVEEI